MIKYIILGLSFVCFVGGVSALAMAQEGATIPTKEAQEHIANDPMVEEQKEAVQASRDLIEALVNRIKDEEKKHFFLIYNTYNLLSTVEVVRSDVEEAIEQCGDKNADMKGELNQRFDEWDDAIETVMDEANDNLDNLVIAQDYAKKKEIKHIFKSLDEAREATDSRFQKIPVTSSEACAALNKKMDGTQENLLKLLRSTLVSFPQAVQVLESGEVPMDTKQDDTE